MKPTQLYLLVPDQLPSQNELNDAGRASILPSLNLALESLELDSQEEAIDKINLALAILKPSDILPIERNNCNFKSTKKYRETLDYDRYFNIRHIKSNNPEICLLKSILVAYQCFLLLEQESEQLNLENMKIQRQGFKSYFLLLARVYNLIADINHEQN